jgi:hypothetical protein
MFNGFARKCGFPRSSKIDSCFGGRAASQVFIGRECGNYEADSASDGAGTQ